MNDVRIFTMKNVIARTGLTDHTIRVWERRYGAVKPERSESNQRLYSESDIAKLQFLKLLTDAGHRINTIASSDLQALSNLLVSENRKVIDANPSTKAQQEATLEQAVEYVKRFDSIGLEQLLIQQSISQSVTTFIFDFIEPLLVQVGDDWEKGKLRVSHEHLASAVVRTVLLTVLKRSNPSDAKETVIFTTPSGQLHELGAIISAILATQHNIHVLYLGPNLPANEIAYSCNQLENVTQIVLSILYPLDDPNLKKELQQLKELLPPKVRLVVGGNKLEFYKQILKKINALHVETFNQLDVYFSRKTS